ncbi:iron-siderophore ABC transporter substrate-binding protein [Spiractinospora alimapuensis]|uniref:ABC transporter substrate-binding protein n=1 Tax=Spiractinospora alimapuensis TaxID=2820884 RepID=UPI001F3D4725|nr:iron-siderophore ABC transporter substrate-binding protein [Spiractinospora alimapuensis]QVQ52217.1 iron-siderophore ABC transporter substrate-binding protein [Spiractinospora alimapuensis]
MPSARHHLPVAGGVIALLLTAACGTDAEGDETPAGDGDYPLTVEHAMGETEIPEVPETVVALDTTYLDSAIALEAEVIGRTDYADSGDIRDYLGEDGQTYAGDAEVVGTLEAPDLAAIAALEPDLILSAKVRHEDVYDQLDAIAPTVFSETTGATWKENHLLAGEALGRSDLAREQVDDYEERAAALGEEIAAANGGDMPTMTLARFAGEPTVRLYAPESYPGIIQADVGLGIPEEAPDAAEGEIAVNLSQEEILDLDADHIMVSTWDDGAGESEEKAQDFTGNPLWSQLEGEQHEVNDEVWVSSVSLPGANSVLDEIADLFDVQA